MIFKIVLLSIIGVVFASYFKYIKPEYGIMIGLAISVIIFYAIVFKLSELTTSFINIFPSIDEQKPMLSVLIKMLGISYICELSSGICKDAGYNSISTSIVIIGKITIMVMGSSILISLIRYINELL